MTIQMTFARNWRNMCKWRTKWPPCLLIGQLPMPHRTQNIMFCVESSSSEETPNTPLFRQAFIDIPMLTSIDLGKRTSLHTMESQGRSQDFPLGGANLEKGPCLGYPLKLKTPRSWPTKKIKCAVWGPCFVLEGHGPSPE